MLLKYSIKNGAYTGCDLPYDLQDLVPELAVIQEDSEEEQNHEKLGAQQIEQAVKTLSMPVAAKLDLVGNSFVITEKTQTTTVDKAVTEKNTSQTILGDMKCNPINPLLDMEEEMLRNHSETPTRTNYKAVQHVQSGFEHIDEKNSDCSTDIYVVPETGEIFHSVFLQNLVSGKNVDNKMYIEGRAQQHEETIEDCRGKDVIVESDSDEYVE